jgi:acyl-coenzyme A synthetase/AMP-(fatty) acid ligase
VILGETKSATNTASAPGTAEVTLDDIFRHTVARRPDAIALADPPNRASFTDGPPRRLSYTEADRNVSAIAERLRLLGLDTDTVVGIQLPNTVEAVLTLLGVLRAGMIAAPMPLLWRQADVTEALIRIGAKMIMTVSRVDDFDHIDLAMRVAVELFPIRYIGGFGSDIVDGVVPFDDLLAAEKCEPPMLEREGNPAAHVAVVTFDVTPDGLVAVARSHKELIAGGLAALLEANIKQDAAILGCCAVSSFAGMALTVLPWVLTGGTLSLHHAFDPDAFATQCREDRCDTVVVPGPLVPRLVEAGLLANAELRNVLAVWRAPERLPISPAWTESNATLVDVMVFGETALLGSRRKAGGNPTSPPAGEILAPCGSDRTVLVAEIARTETGTVAIRGPMVPRHPFPPGAENFDGPQFRADAGGFVDTGYSCRLDRDTGTYLVTGPPPGIITVGGYRFVLSELENLVRRADDGAAVTALPDALVGHRLAGIADDAGNTRAALVALGANPLLADAFRDRRGPKAA